MTPDFAVATVAGPKAAVPSARSAAAPVPAAGREPGGLPVCPGCQRRLVMIAVRSGRDAAGASVRYQLWGCPRGHATAVYADGVFGPIDLLPDV